MTGPDLPAGATVEVTGADGAVLQVRPLARADSLAPSPHGQSGGAAAGCPGAAPTEPLPLAGPAGRATVPCVKRSLATGLVAHDGIEVSGCLHISRR